MKIESTRYFWCLDNEISQSLLSEYEEALEERPESLLKNKVTLLKKGVPVPPMVYLTTALNESETKRPSEQLLKELNLVLSRMEKLTHCTFGAPKYPLLITIQGDFCGAIRNIGIGEHNLSALIHQLGVAQTYSIYVDFLESFSSLVLGCPPLDFRKAFQISESREGQAG